MVSTASPRKSRWTTTEQRILKAVRKVRRLGWKLTSNLTINRATKCCCPIGALALVQNPQVKDIGVRELGPDRLWLFGFMDGFDGHSRTQWAHPTSLLYRRGHKSGDKFRRYYRMP